MSNRDNLLGVLGTIYRWRKTLLMVCLIALIGSIGLALWMDNYYKSTTIFYPSNQDLSKPELIFGGMSRVTEFFGNDKDVDRLLEIAAGNELIDYMIDRFKLFEHYQLDSTTKDGRHWARMRFQEAFVVQKNKNDAIELTVEDTDPQMASDMANAAREKIDQIAQRLVKENLAKILASYDVNIKRKTSELQRLGDTLRTVQSKYRIFSGADQGSQLARLLTRAEDDIARNSARLEVLQGNPLVPPDTVEYIKANLRGARREREMLLAASPRDGNVSIRDFNEGIGQVAIANDLHNQARKQLSFDLERYNQVLAAQSTNIPAVQLVEMAEPAIVKSRPKRGVIVIGAVVAAFLFTLFAAFLADAYKEIRWEEFDKA